MKPLFLCAAPTCRTTGLKSVHTAAREDEDRDYVIVGLYCDDCDTPIYEQFIDKWRFDEGQSPSISSVISVSRKCPHTERGDPELCGVCQILEGAVEGINIHLSTNSDVIELVDYDAMDTNRDE